MNPAPFQPRFFDASPLYWPIVGGARRFSDMASWPSVVSYSERIAHRAPVTFREQPKKPRGRRRGPRCAGDLYDGRIIEEGWVPTRPENWHDFLNMLCWAAFPEAKWHLHNRQHKAMSARVAGAVDALPNARTREQDALALMDEGGVVVLCHEPSLAELTAALAERHTPEAKALFASGTARGLVFGHALYEGLVLGGTEAWGAGFLAAIPSPPRDSDDASLVRQADSALARALATDGTFASPAFLARVDLNLLRPSD